MNDDDELQQPAHAPSILGIATGCVAYVAAHRFGHPLFVYLPQTGEWSTDTPPDLIGMGYYGLVPYGLLGFLLGWALAKIPAVGTWLGTSAARMLTVAGAAAMGGALLYHLAAELTVHHS